MRIYLHIGPDQWATARLQEVLDSKREGLADKRILFPRAAGPRNHTRLFMAITDPDRVDVLRFNRGYLHAQEQESLRRDVVDGLAREVERVNPDVMILSAHQLGTGLVTRAELDRLRAMLLPLSDDIRIVAHVEDQARMLARAYAAQVIEGRATPLQAELDMAKTSDWWDSCLDARPVSIPQKGMFAEAQSPNFWLDYAGLVRFWESAFGTGSVTLRALDIDAFCAPDLTDEIRASFGIEDNIGRAIACAAPDLPSAVTLTRARGLNDLILRWMDKRNRVLPRQPWRRMLDELSYPGAPISPGTLAAVSDAFSNDNKGLITSHPGLDHKAMTPDTASDPWTEPDMERGFRPSQFLLANLFRVEKAAKEALREQREEKARAKSETQDAQDAPALAAHGTDPVETDNLQDDPSGLSAIAAKIMPPLAKEKFKSLLGSSFRPHNRLGAVNEEELAAAFSPISPRDLPKGSSGNVIVGCMKNEAPYIVEWVAYHRAMGVDNFLIYTNGCEDGTSEILDRLQEMGILQHRNNDGWKGNSPQQYALNQALKEPVIKNADWIIHIDVDEFMNVRCGNGTLQDFFDRVPDATNVAMTWRLFGHNNVTRLADEFVIDQFDTCAPKFCPKPHTVWGFKTMFRNIGAYEKISCHRPNKLDEAFKDKVKWVNGSGADMTHEAKDNGWRNSKKSIGYDLLQLNHYALRSAESFLIKRQRGRALHVDRSIGLNYWIRMDWSDFKDITIKRNIPRLRAEYDRLMQDAELAKWHQTGLDWHRAKAEELHEKPEFEDLYQQALKVKLNETERVAYALALDMES